MSGASNIITSAIELVRSFVQLGEDHGKIKLLVEKLKLLDDTLINKEQAIENYRAQIKELKERLNED